LPQIVELGQQLKDFAAAAPATTHYFPAYLKLLSNISSTGTYSPLLFLQCFFAYCYSTFPMLFVPLNISFSRSICYIHL
jgi:hypothetical protein